MSAEKLIEEMAKVYEKARFLANETLGSMNEGEGKWYAKAFYEAGYRKASDVAKEILTDRTLIDHLERACGAGGKLALSRINELKKEYEVTQC